MKALDAMLVIERALPGRSERDVPMASFTAYKVGGPADLFVEPDSPAELVTVLEICDRENIPFLMLGAGTNMLVRDGGIRGVVMRLGREFRAVRIEGHHLIAGAMAPMSKVALAAEKAGLEGMVFGYDIPGTVGGILRMNAGAHGQETKDVLFEARGYDVRGQFHAVPVAQIRFAYRTAVYPVDLVFTEGVFALTPGSQEDLARRRQENHAYRLSTQPKGHTVGSVFVNPPGDHAGRLVEAAGLKGFRIGKAVVSTKHGNWIVNEGGQSAADIEELIRTIQARVRERFGVELKTEVRIVGEPAGG